ncbi:hypothetical protein V490_09064, partial [Pseudogymnoascus sp. VKM F-3557]
MAEKYPFNIQTLLPNMTITMTMTATMAAAPTTTAPTDMTAPTTMTSTKTMTISVTKEQFPKQIQSWLIMGSFVDLIQRILS